MIAALGRAPRVVSPYRCTPSDRASSEPCAPQPADVYEAPRTSLLRRLAVGAMLSLSMLGAMSLSAPPALAAQTVKVLSLNVQVDSMNGVPNIVKLIRTTGADIVGLQESDKNTPTIAKSLGFQYVDQDHDRAVLSRWPIIGTTPHKAGVTVRLPSGKPLTVFNIHPYYKPYQPYQLLSIPYEDGRFIKTEAEAIEEARKARGADFDALQADLATRPDRTAPMIVTGDFNEPSHLDWTAAAAKSGRHPIKVTWPGTKSIADAGFKDAYRTLHPDEMKFPGFTWTPTTRPDDPKDHHDRIDFVMYRGAGLKVTKADIVGENKANATIVVSPYPTDHRGVMATFEVR